MTQPRPKRYGRGHEWNHTERCYGHSCRCRKHAEPANKRSCVIVTQWVVQAVSSVGVVCCGVVKLACMKGAFKDFGVMSIDDLKDMTEEDFGEIGMRPFERCVAAQN